MDQDLSQLDPLVIAALMQGGDYDPQRQQAMRQQKVIDSLRSSSMQPIQTQSVNGMVLPNWGQALSQGLQGIGAMAMQGQVDKTMGEVNARDAANRQYYVTALTNALRRRTPASTPAPQLEPKATMPPNDPNGIAPDFFDNKGVY
jgi:hypothetical protein